MKVCVFLANGFETVEALAVVDILRRAAIDTVTVSITGTRNVESSQKIMIQADTTFEEAKEECYGAEVVFLPGGMPGTLNLQAHKGVISVVEDYFEKGKIIAAICAAPSILGGLGMLQGRNATSHASVVEKLTGATYLEQPVVVDGNIITSQGMGTAIPLGLELVRKLAGDNEAQRISKAIHLHSYGGKEND